MAIKFTNANETSVSKHRMAESHWMSYPVTYATSVANVCTCGDAYHLHNYVNLATSYMLDAALAFGIGNIL